MTNPKPLHPGDVIHKSIADLGITQKDLAAAMGIMLPRLNELVNRRRKVTSNIALRLAKVLGTTPEYWMHLQVDWDLHQAALKNDYSEIKPIQLGDECKTSVASSV